VRLALHDFANRNWLHEQQMGRMIALKPTPQYANDRSRYKDQIDQYYKQIAKTVDLFSRIKSTAQAEEVITVLYASRQVKQLKHNGEIADKDLFDFILDWKKSWRTEQKKEAVASAIRNLMLLGWVRLTVSEWMIEGV
ncbi:MAG: hypothetical protein WBZ39_05760, partial [Methylovirgula sp.]